MKKILMISLLMSSLAQALSPTPASSQTKIITYHHANVHVGDGEVMEGATLSFENGKITRLGYYRAAWQQGDIDLKGKNIYPGLILPVTNLGLIEVDAVKATKDDVEVGQNNANVRSIIAYNTDSEITPTLKFNGILLAQTTPQGGLISGLSSVVQLDAWNWEDAAIVVDDAVHVNWPSSTKAKFDMSSFKMISVVNNKHEEQLEEIKSLFSQAKANAFKSNEQVNLKRDAVIPVFNGNRKVFIHTNNPKSIIASINYFKGLGVKSIVLVTGQGSLPVIGFIKHSEVPVIVSLAHQLPQRKDNSVDAGYTTAIKLNKAKILVGLGYSGAMSSRNLAFTAGTLVSYGMKKEQALKLITSNTAKILGIDKNYGTLKVGKSATFFISEGDALDMKGNILTDAYIDGRKINLDGRQQELNKRYIEKYKNSQ